MARTRTATGKRRVIGLKVSEAKFAAVERARGGQVRSEWVEAAIDKALAEQGVMAEPACPSQAGRTQGPG